MMPNHTRIPRWPLAALPMALVFALVASSAGQARPDDDGRDEPPSNESKPAPFGPGNPGPILVPPFDDPNRPPYGDPNWPQICYEVRLVKCKEIRVEDDDRINDSLPENAPVEIVADRAITWLLDKGQIIHAPKVTAFEGSTATIVLHSDGSLRQEPALRVDLGGTVPVGDRECIRLSVALSDATTADLDSPTHPAEPTVDPAVAPPSQAGAATADATYLYRGIIDAAEGETVVISIPAPSDIEVDAPDQVDRLILITPRRIILEEAEEHLGLPAVPVPPAGPTPE